MIDKVEEIVIDDKNFHQFFFDVRKHGPKNGQVMAKFSAFALFGEGNEKRDIINLLKGGRVFQAAMIMNKIYCARTPDCYRVCREICEDMISGMTEDEVANKEYEFVIESMFYTKKEYIPKNNPHWELLTSLKYNSDTNTFESRIDLD
jgi:hypothetical protein